MKSRRCAGNSVRNTRPTATKCRAGCRGSARHADGSATLLHLGFGAVAVLAEAAGAPRLRRVVVCLVAGRRWTPAELSRPVAHQSGDAPADGGALSATHRARRVP